MTVKQLSENGNFNVLNMPCPDCEITGAYIGDLLSNAMIKVKKHNVWLTVMTNINVIAIAVNSDVACIILTENAKLDAKSFEAAKQRDVNVISTSLTSFETAVLISELGVI